MAIFRMQGAFSRVCTRAFSRQARTNGIIGVRRNSVINWRLAAVMLGAGGYLAYSELVFDKYSEYVAANTTDTFLPVQLDFKLRSLPLYQTLMHSATSKDWVKLSSWENLDRNVLDSKAFSVKAQEEYRDHSLTNNTLAQPGGILLKPVIFHNILTDETITIVHMGYKLCGYPFIVHGGIIATLLNETFKRNASLSAATSSSLKDDYKVESLSINYKRPSFANQFFVVKSKIENVDTESRSATLKSSIESENGQVLVESVAMLRNTGRARRKATESQAAKWAIF